MHCLQFPLESPDQGRHKLLWSLRVCGCCHLVFRCCYFTSMAPSPRPSCWADPPFSLDSLGWGIHSEFSVPWTMKTLNQQRAVCSSRETQLSSFWPGPIAILVLPQRNSAACMSLGSLLFKWFSFLKCHHLQRTCFPERKHALSDHLAQWWHNSNQQGEQGYLCLNISLHKALPI